MEPQLIVFLFIAAAITVFLFGRNSTKGAIEALKKSEAERSRHYVEGLTALREGEATIRDLKSQLANEQRLSIAKQTELEAVKKIEAERTRQYVEGRTSIRERDAMIRDLKSQLENEKQQFIEKAEELTTQAGEEIHALKDQYADLKAFSEGVLVDWKKQGILLPALRDWAGMVQSEYDKVITDTLESRRAWKAAEAVREAKAETRRLKNEASRLKLHLSLYEALAPWLDEYCNLSVEEILDGLKEEAEIKEFYRSGGDPVSLFVPRAEWEKLTEAERNQLALDRYWHGSRRKSAWTAGIQYERYIGFLYEADGYKVAYQGATQGVDDLGIDLICKRNDVTRIVQCKRLSVAKGLPVRENVIAQVFGAGHFYAMEAKNDSVIQIDLCTTYECSETARKFAKHLNVNLFERVPFEPYPSIKCNISQLTGERIYHLPFDQHYDSVIVGDMAGEFYAMTVAEAETAGFRRAFRWRGGA